MTTNRKWLETLSDEEYASEIKQIVMSAMNDTTNAIYQDLILESLQAKHEKTADEEMAEHDYIKTEQNEFMVIYKATEQRGDSTEVYVYPKETTVLFLPNKMTRFVHLEDNEIRIIADKKRCEMGWDK